MSFRFWRRVGIAPGVTLNLSRSGGSLSVGPRGARLAARIENQTRIHTALLLYQAKALHRPGLLQAARDTLTKALRRRKGRSPELLRALRHERALVYQPLGQHRRARTELEKIYAEDPDDRAVADLSGTGPDHDTRGGQS